MPGRRCKVQWPISNAWPRLGVVSRSRARYAYSFVRRRLVDQRRMTVLLALFSYREPRARRVEKGKLASVVVGFLRKLNSLEAVALF